LHVASLVELTAPSLALEQVSSLLERVRVVHVWPVASTTEEGLLRVLVDSRDVESLSDLVSQHFEGQVDFRIFLMPVEATLPPVDEAARDEVVGSEEDDSGVIETQRISREEMYEDLVEATRLTPVFVVLVAISTIVAAVGLIRDDVVIIIGAMVIAPLRARSANSSWSAPRFTARIPPEQSPYLGVEKLLPEIDIPVGATSESRSRPHSLQQ
jgi:hypothetical protein